MLKQKSLTFPLTKVLLILISYLPVLQSRPTFGIGLSVRAEDGDVRFPSVDPTSPEFWWMLGISFSLVLIGGVFSGLTLALLSQDEITLQVLKASGDEYERVHAGKVLRLLKRGKNWVLCTLLLSNVIVNETLPIIFDSVLGGGWPAVVLSTTLIVIFGEIIPQAACVRYGLPIGARCSSYVLGLMYVMYPLAYPTALLLDNVLGKEEGTTYKKAGLKTLVALHRTLGTERLNDDEVTIITAVLDLKEKPVGDIMTPLRDVYVMSADQIMDVKTMNEILSKGYSRIPIHTPGQKQDFIGMLLVKTLITYDPEEESPVSTFTLATLPETKPQTSALDILNYFQEGKSHMVLVSESPGEDHGALGVVTLEDVIEELIGEEIVDETDVFVDVSRHLKRMNPTAAFAQHSFHRISSRQALAEERGKLSRAGSNTSAPPLTGTMKPLNKASEPIPSTSTKVTIKPGTEVRNAHVVTAQERLLGKKAARGNYEAIASAESSTREADARDRRTSRGSGTLIEERITISGNGENGKVVITPVKEDPDDDDETAPLL